MKLKVINTGSVGNCYLLENENEVLMIECGVNIKEIKKALNFSFSKVVGAIVSHEHLDHYRSAKDLMKLGVNVYATEGTFGGFSSNRAKTIKAHAPFPIGEFKVMPFDIRHDAKEPVCFLINHPQCGNVLFLSDSFYCPYTFNNLNNIIVEANFSKEIIDRKMREGASPEFLRNRILKSHLSLENCKELLRANDLSQVNNIVLIHLSDSHSNEQQFQSEIQNLTGKNVTVASAGMEIGFTKTPF